jgi:hypothetical protein
MRPKFELEIPAFVAGTLHFYSSRDFEEHGLRFASVHSLSRFNARSLSPGAGVPANELPGQHRGRALGCGRSLNPLPKKLDPLAPFERFRNLRRKCVRRKNFKRSWINTSRKKLSGKPAGFRLAVSTKKRFRVLYMVVSCGDELLGRCNHLVAPIHEFFAALN